MKYYYSDASFNPVGPITAEQLQELYRAGKINSNTAILEDGKTQQSDWKPFNHIVPLVAAAPANTIYKADASVVSDAKFAKAYGAVNKPVKVAQLPVDVNPYTASTAVVKNSKRYKNGYTTANQIVKFGDACKLLGLIILIGGILAGFGAFALLGDHSKGEIYLQATTYFCLSIAATPVPVWAGLHILGVIICALGEILLATLDTAVNTTKHENL